VKDSSKEEQEKVSSRLESGLPVSPVSVDTMLDVRRLVNVVTSKSYAE